MSSKIIELAKAVKLVKKENAKKDYHKFSKMYLWITDKSGTKMKLNQNNAQNIIQNKIEELRSNGIPPRIIILKSRQMGITTDSQGRMVFNTSTKDNRFGLIASHDSDSTKKIFRKTKYMTDNMEEEVKPLMRASNAKELLFDTPLHYKGDDKGLHSGITVQVAGSDGMGRSEALHYAHLSEYAFWDGSDDKAPHMQLAGIMQAVPDELDTWVIIESTARGYNDFKDEWDKAVKGESGFYPIFLPWYIHEEYIREVKDKEIFIETMSKYEKWLHEELDLPIERVSWWRHTLKVKCSGDINVMKQENPTTPEEAFLFSGTPVFDVENIAKRIKYLEDKQIETPYKTGYFEFEWRDEEYKDKIIDSTIRFIESEQKPYVRIYEDRKTHFPYVIAGDTKGEGKDSYTGQVMDNTNRFRVATLEMQMNNSKPYTWQMYCMGKYFNGALIGIEMNFNTAPLEELIRLKYYKMYYREKPEGYHGETVGGKVGWKTDGITRPRMIDKEIYLTQEYLYLIRDIPTLKEMMTFVYDKNGRPDAMSGKHDDLLIADCMLDEISGQQTRMPDYGNNNRTIAGEFFGVKKEDNGLVDQSYVTGGSDEW